jgi:putative hemolysin
LHDQIQYCLEIPYSDLFKPEAFTHVSSYVQLLSVLILMLLSGLVSGAETALYSISPAQLLQINESEKSVDQIINRLLQAPKRTLATLVILINFVNIAIVVISTFLIDDFINVDKYPQLGFVLEVFIVTFIIVVFCEVMPKVYATQNAIAFSRTIAYPIFLIDKIIRPLTWMLTASSALVEKLFSSKAYDISNDDLTHAIDITSDKNTPEDEKKILKGIARFSDIDVKQIMKPRVDVLAFDIEENFAEILPRIVENRYSRIPVYHHTFDHIKGILFIKDLLPYIDSHPTVFKWAELIRPAYFVPESKKINDLLHEFQTKKNHLAIVLDEYGGSQGIVTLEDILEEIVGEINDEYDDEELNYSRLDDFNYVFEGKALLNDIARIVQIDRSRLEAPVEGVETLAGLLLELHGTIPERNATVIHNKIKYIVESADKRKIKRVKIVLPKQP